MNKVLNLKIIFIIIFAVIISFFTFIKLNVETVDTTQNFVEITTDLIDNFSKSETKTKVHGNSDKNKKLHIVYEIYGIDAWEEKTTIKFGISGRKNYKRKKGNPRPNLQLKSISKNPLCEHFYKVEYKILNEKVQGREATKILEKKYVTEYYYKYNRMPLLQKLPLPEEDLFNF